MADKLEKIDAIAAWMAEQPCCTFTRDQLIHHFDEISPIAELTIDAVHNAVLADDPQLVAFAMSMFRVDLYLAGYEVPDDYLRLPADGDEGGGT